MVGILNPSAIYALSLAITALSRNVPKKLAWVFLAKIHIPRTLDTLRVTIRENDNKIPLQLVIVIYIECSLYLYKRTQILFVN